MGDKRRDPGAADLCLAKKRFRVTLMQFRELVRMLDQAVTELIDALVRWDGERAP